MADVRNLFWVSLYFKELTIWVWQTILTSCLNTFHHFKSVNKCHKVIQSSQTSDRVSYQTQTAATAFPETQKTQPWTNAGLALQFWRRKGTAQLSEVTMNEHQQSSCFKVPQISQRVMWIFKKDVEFSVPFSWLCVYLRPAQETDIYELNRGLNFQLHNGLKITYQGCIMHPKTHYAPTFTFMQPL